MKKQKRSPSIYTRLQYFIRRRWRLIVPLLVILVALPFLIPPRTRHDRLVYSVSTYENVETRNDLMLYNPNTGKSTTILTVNARLFRFSVSREGRLAYSSGYDPHADIFVRDSLSPDAPSLNISQSLESYKYAEVLSWSPDGQYLVFYTLYYDRTARLFAWNGTDSLDITPTDIGDDMAFTYFSDLAWSSDGRLSFTGYYQYRDKLGVSGITEIYLWNSETIISISQNSTGDDRWATWNSNDELAFLSEKDGGWGLYFWDGISLKDNLPDVMPFAGIEPDFIHYLSKPVWTNENLLAFMSRAEQYDANAIYIWDGSTLVNVAQDSPNFVNIDPVWSSDGILAFRSLGRYQNLLIVRDNQNNTLMTTPGEESPAWSSDGDLVFCSMDGGWLLNLWDGEEIISLTQQTVSVVAIAAQWQSGTHIFCTTG